MAITDNASLSYESGQQYNAFAAMTDSGDHLKFTLATKPWSNKSGYEYKIRPYGLVTGGAATPTGTNNQVSIAALTAYMAAATGATSDGLVTVNTGNLLATRGSTNGYRITSLTVDSTGALAAVPGTESTAFTETRGAAGGPPLIPVGSIEIGQVRLTSTTAGVVQASEIYQVIGTHQERWDYPVWTEDPANGTITFVAAQPLIHTGPAAKAVYAQVYTPIFAELPRSRNYAPAEVTNSVSSITNYDGAEGTVSFSLGQCSFEASLNDGITDAILSQKNQTIWIKFKQDRNKTPYQLTLGKLSVGRTYSVGARPSTKFTLSASSASVDFAS